MPDPTTRYGWNPPNVGGDTGAWGTILNTLIDAVDEQVFQNARDISGTNNKLVPASDGGPLTDSLSVSSGVAGWYAVQDGTKGLGAKWSQHHSVVGPDLLKIPLPHLRVGQRITAFASRGSAPASATTSVKLKYRDSSNVITEVSSGHALPAVEATTTTSGLTHDVVANREYFIEVSAASVTAADTVLLWFVQTTVITTP